MELNTILSGALGGVAYSLFRLWDERTKAAGNWEGFSLKKFLRTVIIGAGIGAFVPLTGLSTEATFLSVESLSIYAGIVLAVETTLKRIWVWARKKLGR